MTKQQLKKLNEWTFTHSLNIPQRTGGAARSLSVLSSGMRAPPPHRRLPPSQSCCSPLHDKVLLKPCWCDSAMKKNDVLLWAAAWTNPENIMLSERSRSQRVTFRMKYVFPLYERPRTGESIETKRRLAIV